MFILNSVSHIFCYPLLEELCFIHNIYIIVFLCLFTFWEWLFLYYVCHITMLKFLNCTQSLLANSKFLLLLRTSTMLNFFFVRLMDVLPTDNCINKKIFTSAYWRGSGIIYLKIQNDALLTKRLSYITEEPQGHWAATLMSYYILETTYCGNVIMRLSFGRA